MALAVRRFVGSLFVNSSRSVWFQGCNRARFASTIIEDEDFKLRYLDGEQEGIAEFCMTRPKAKNAMSKNMVKHFYDALSTVRFDPAVRVVVIRSEAPGIFCAGADLKERAQMTASEVGPFVASLRQLISDLDSLPMPTIAAMDGAALGGGLEMALACDLRVASTTAKMGVVETRLAIIPGGGTTAKMGLVETRLAIIPGAGGTQRLPRLVGPAKAKELIFTARVVDGQEAAEIGLVNAAVGQNADGDAAYRKAIELAEEIIPNGPVAVRMAKQAISKGVEVDINSGLGFEQACYAQVIPTKDRIEGLMAFKEKRPPKYRGE